MIYCSLIERDLNDNDYSILDNPDTLVFSSFVKNEKIFSLNTSQNSNPLSLNYIFSLDDKIQDEEYYFIDLSNCENYQKYLEIKNYIKNFEFLDNTEIDICRVMCSLKDRVDFIKKHGEYHRYRFPLLIKGSLFKEIVRYIRLMMCYDVVVFHIEAFFAIVRKIIDG